MHTQTYVNNNILWTVLDVWSQEVVKVLELVKRNLVYVQDLQIKYGDISNPRINFLESESQRKLKSVHIFVDVPWCKERNMFYMRLNDDWDLDKEANCNMSFWKFFFQICYRKGNILYFYKIK